MTKTPRKWAKYAVVGLVFLIFYVVTVIPVGLFLYTLKSNAGWNVFKTGGYHTYLKCLAVSVEIPGYNPK